MNYLVRVSKNAASAKARSRRRVRVALAWGGVVAFGIIVAFLMSRLCFGSQVVPGATTASIGVAVPDGASSGQVDPLRPLLNAVRQVESGGVENPPDGDNGESIGPLQIQRAAWTDACKYGGVQWPYEWARQLDKAERVFVWYTDRYGARTAEERSRCWNSGPKWREKYGKTDGYWARVKAELEERP